jgi:hypothetical protein
MELQGPSLRETRARAQPGGPPEPPAAAAPPSASPRKRP